VRARRMRAVICFQSVIFACIVTADGLVGQQTPHAGGHRDFFLSERVY
jgi:hypothetical protein